MKRALTVLAGMALVLGSAGCSTDSTPSPAPSGTAAATASSTTPASATSVPSQPTVSPGERGADGSTGNSLGAEYCAKRQDPGCPLGSYVGPDAIENPNGDGTWVPCEGTICTNPDHGAGPGTTAPAEIPAPVDVPSITPQNSAQVEGAPCEGDGHWVRLDGGNAGHYGTEWLCRH
ncbi:hypothetical protein QX204_11500 [Nocardia sp. PE-7]|uniref:hypothetical protein n=1 Tax=Nocardia sp. PE-7 TaxID=3058426 RepID=UPI002659D2CB|nr:hypothetical protein [Nocardia sp. PE-7]WKG12048.1 hypothetical protein QX204_11500 [Nocardia sp. PE-7]